MPLLAGALARLWQVWSAQGAAGYAEAHWRSLQFFNIFKLVIALVLLGGVLMSDATVQWGSHDRALFVRTTITYLIFGVLSVPLIFARWHFNVQIALQVFADIVFITILIYASRGVTSGLGRGVVASYPLIDIAVEVLGGAFSEQDSDEIAFQIAAAMAFNEACKAAAPVLLEPMMKVEIIVPAESMGSVIGDVSARRGNIRGMNQRGITQVIDADVPLAEMFGYVDSLRSLTSGRGGYTMQFGNYAPITPNVLQALLLRLRGY